MSDVILFTDQSGASTGTPVEATIFDSLMISDSCIVGITGSIPTSSSNNILTMPAMQVIVNTGTTTNTAQLLTISSQAVTFGGGANKDNYLYINSSGAYSQIPVNTGNPAPSNPGLLCVGFATTNGSNVITVFKTLAALYRITLADEAQQAAINTLTGTSFGTNTKAAILADGTNAASTVTVNNLTLTGALTGGSPAFGATYPIQNVVLGNSFGGTIATSAIVTAPVTWNNPGGDFQYRQIVDFTGRTKFAVTIQTSLPGVTGAGQLFIALQYSPLSGGTPTGTWTYLDGTTTSGTGAVDVYTASSVPLVGSKVALTAGAQTIIVIRPVIYTDGTHTPGTNLPSIYNIAVLVE